MFPDVVHPSRGLFSDILCDVSPAKRILQHFRLQAHVSGAAAALGTITAAGRSSNVLVLISSQHSAVLLCVTAGWVSLREPP